MVKIVKGENKMEVTRSAFDNFYKNAGWEVLPEVVSEDSDDEWGEVLKEYEKPLSQMNNTELIEKAISLGLEINGNVTNRQLREMISAASRQN